MVEDLNFLLSLTMNLQPNSYLISCNQKVLYMHQWDDDWYTSDGRRHDDIVMARMHQDQINAWKDIQEGHETGRKETWEDKRVFLCLWPFGFLFFAYVQPWINSQGGGWFWLAAPLVLAAASAFAAWTVSFSKYKRIALDVVLAVSLIAFVARFIITFEG